LALLAFLLGYDNFLNDTIQNPNSGLPSPVSMSFSEPGCSYHVYGRKETHISFGWVPPSPSNLKMNVDASFSKETSEAAAGITVRDHLGTVVLAASIQLQTCRDAEEAEANVVGVGLNLAIPNDLNMENVESDNAAVVTSMNSLVSNASIHWHVYKDIRKLRESFPDLVVIKVGSNCNRLFFSIKL
jgi:hypothetical protein